MAEGGPLDKSLDDLIAEQRKKQQKPKRPVKPVPARARPAAMDEDKEERGDRRRGRGSSGGGGSAPANLTITIRGGVNKGDRGPRGGGEGPVDRQAPEQRLAALEGSARWGHDMFAGRRGGGDGPRRRDPRDATSLGTKLFVSNLDYNVSDDDIKELFGAVGSLVRAVIVYDHSGRSEGQAEIIYEREADARRAMERYQGVALDGQAMEIELVPQAAPGAAGGGGGGAQTLRSGIRVSGGPPAAGRLVGATRGFQQALGGVSRSQPRGRGSIRGSAAMDME